MWIIGILFIALVFAVPPALPKGPAFDAEAAFDGTQNVAFNQGLAMCVTNGTFEGNVSIISLFVADGSGAAVNTTIEIWRGNSTTPVEKYGTYSNITQELSNTTHSWVNVSLISGTAYFNGSSTFCIVAHCKLGSGDCINPDQSHKWKINIGNQYTAGSSYYNDGTEAGAWTANGANDLSFITYANTTAASPSSTPINLTITAIDIFDGSSILNITATLTTETNNITFTTSNGTIPIGNITNGYYNITIASNQSGGYLNRTYLNFNASGTTLQASIWQAEIYANASDTTSITQIMNFGIKTNGSSLINLSNSTGWANLRLKKGTYNLTINSTPYDTQNYPFTITNYEQLYFTSNFSNAALLTINATNIISGTDIDTFEIRLRNNGSISASPDSNKSTSSGSIQFSLVNGTYILSFVSSNYTLANTTLIINITASKLPNYTFVIYSINSFNISIWDEIKGKPSPFNTTASTPVSFEISSNVYSTNFSTSNSSYYIDLLTPSDYRISYITDKYRQRQYYFTITNGTHQVLDLYLLSITNGTLTTFTITDQNANPVLNYTFQAQRYYIYSNTYEIIAMAKTDAQGKVSIDLQQNNAFYKFIITDTRGTIRLDTVPSTVFATEYSLSINTQTDTLSEVQARNSANLPITFSNITNIFTFTYNSLTGLAAAQTCLTVNEFSLKSSNNICNTCSTSGSATLLCDASSSINNNITVIANAFTYQGIGDNSTAILLDSMSIIPTKVTNLAKDIFGTTGVLMAFFIVLSMVLIGLWNPIVSMIFGTLGFIGSYLIGLISLGSSGLSWVIGLVLLAGIIMYRSRA